MRSEQPIPSSPSEETALHFIVEYLTKGRKPEHSHFGYSFYVVHAIDAYLRAQGMTGELTHAAYRVSAPFLSACWDLCRRGVFRPTVYQLNGQVAADGGGYSVTAFGQQWLEEAKSGFDYVPLEPGHLAELLSKFSGKFGPGFHERAQDAVRCHRAHAYLACCAMCGAGAESIFLALAIQKSGDPKATEATYFSKNGRSRIEATLIGQQPTHIQAGFKAFTGLLKYWRDMSAHGRQSQIEEVEAFTSVLLLLRFAQFASDHRDELTT